jgi:transcriptional regulator PpsR
MTERTPVAVDLGALSMLAPQLAATFVSVASDIALVIDQGGVIRNVALGTEPITSNPQDWVGKPWVDTVTGDTRQKIESLLQEARAGGVTRRREVNHPVDGGQQVPVAYAAVRLGSDGPVLAVGRDLRAVSAIQQRFIDAQQSMERDYWRQRQAEARYRMLFQVATDGVLVVDAHSLRIVEANHAAAELFHREPGTMAGRAVSEGIVEAMRPTVDELLVAARTTGRPGEVRALLAGAPGIVAAAPAIDLSATPFRAEDTMLLLVRLRIADGLLGDAGSGHRLPDFVQRTPDAIAIADSAGRVLMGNPAFTQLCRDAGGLSAAEAGPVGRALVTLLGDATGRLGGALDAVRLHGIAEQCPLNVGVDAAHQVEVEVSAALLAEGDQECIGLTLRRVDVRLAAVPPQVGALASALDRLAAQVGIVTLPELLQEATELAERHLIDATLTRAQGDRMQAAQLLGVTAENLWLRMRHHGMTRGGADIVTPPNLLN